MKKHKCVVLQIVFTVIIVLMALSAVIMEAISEANSTARYTEHGRNENLTAIISLPNGEVIEGCPDYCYFDGETVKVQISGVVYLISRSDITLIEVKNE